MEQLRIHAFFSGHVQGVGFRYKTLRVAHEYVVAGYVRNLADGRVELDVSGAPEEVRAFFAQLSDQMAMYIRQTEVRESSQDPGFKGFEIRG